jgi:probable HAF family extracellular repeat protein
MRSTNLICITLAAMLPAALATPLVAQQQAAKHHGYKVIDMGTLGGPTSGINFDSKILSRRGAAVGGADTAIFDPTCGCYNFHAFKWQNGVLTDLGTLPGGDTFSFGIAINSRGNVAGISNNGLIDPVTGVPAFEAVTWNDGKVTNLGTLGGSFSLPNDINSRGQTAGGAENRIPDPDNLGGALIGLPSPTQYRAVLWQNGKVRDLGTLGNGPDSFALFVNERGQADGMSYTSSTPDPVTGIPPIHAFFWERGRMIDVPSLGGAIVGVSGLNNKGQVIGNSSLAGEVTTHPFSWEAGLLRDIGTLGGDNGSATWLNDAGQVVGSADLPGSQTHHAYLWQNGVIKDLGTVGTDPCSRADSINSQGQIVGESAKVCGTNDLNNLVAFFQENGEPMIDLNSFVPPGSGIHLGDGAFINDQGEIAVEGSLNGVDRSFLLVPAGDCDDACENRIAASQRDIGPVRDDVTTRPGSDSPANRVHEFRDRLMHRYHIHRHVGAQSD